MASLYNRFIKMDNSRLAKKVFLWDKAQIGSSWNNEFLRILDIIDYELNDRDDVINCINFSELCKLSQNTE